jgi:hypothetical protein
MIASVLALPAAASHGKPAKATETSASAGPSACKQAILQNAKTYHAKRKADLKAFIQGQKALRVAFNHKDPAPTPEERTAFREQHKAAVKAFHEQRKTERLAFLAAQKAALEACNAKP